MTNLPLSEFVTRALAEAQPLSQNTAPDDLGFGWIYYAMARNLRPDFVVAIGSCRGFMPFCAARALQDRGQGHVIFIDPSYAGDGDPGWGGHAAWSDPAAVNAHIERFGLSGWITHIKATSEEAFGRVAETIGDGGAGLVIIDGAHTAEQSLRDFELYAGLIDGGLVLFHDATNPACGVAETLRTLGARGYPMILIDRDVGLAVVEVARTTKVEDAWAYLLTPSNRGQLLLPAAREIVRRGDRVLDAYCGYSPLGPLLDDVEMVGWDRDPLVIRRLRDELPHHRWERIDELALPFSAALPENVDVLLGLGVSRANAAWDPQRVVDNMRYLLGRYHPRACLFETAADYDSAAILDELAAVLERLGYALGWTTVSTDLDAYGRRKLLIGERA